MAPGSVPVWRAKMPQAAGCAWRARPNHHAKQNESVTTKQVLHDCTYMRFLEQLKKSDPEGKMVVTRGWESGERGSFCLMGIPSSGKEKVLEMDSSDSCTTM